MITGIVATMLSLATFFSPKQPTLPPVVPSERKQDGPHPEAEAPGAPPPLQALMQKATILYPALHKTWKSAHLQLDKGKDPFEVKRMILYDLDKILLTEQIEDVEKLQIVNEKGELVLVELIAAFQKDTFAVGYRPKILSSIPQYTPRK